MPHPDGGGGAAADITTPLRSSLPSRMACLLGWKGELARLELEGREETDIIFL